MAQGIVAALTILTRFPDAGDDEYEFRQQFGSTAISRDVEAVQPSSR
jgi:hypothetical protein